MRKLGVVLLFSVLVLAPVFADNNLEDFIIPAQTNFNEGLNQDSNYIVEFRNVPVTQKISQEVEAKGGLKLSSSAERSIASSQLKKIKEEHQNAFKEFNEVTISDESFFGDKISMLTFIFRNFFKRFYPITGNVVYEENKIEPTREYYSTFNGAFFENLSSEQIQKIKSSKYVKGIYPDGEVNISIYESSEVINADEVWKLDSNLNYCNISGQECLTGKGIKIAILDTGINYYHPDLGGCFGEGCKIEGGYDIVNNDTDPLDDNGHGSHVAGIIAGSPGEFKETTLNISGLSGYWKMNDNLSQSNTVVDKQGTFNGSLVGNAYSFNDGVDGKSMSFNGGVNYVALNNFSANTTGGFTLSLWVNPNNQTDYMSPVGREQDFVLYIYQGDWQFWMWTGSNWDFLSIDSSVDFNKWQHIIVEYTPIYKELLFYKNGILIGYKYGVSYNPLSNNLLSISGKSGNYAFNGSIDEVMIFNRNLTELERSKISAYQSANYYSNHEAKNNKSYVGMALNATLISYKVLGSGGGGSWSGILEGIERAVDPNKDGDYSDSVDVISMSLGGACPFYSIACGPDDVMSRAIDNAVNLGVVAVIAAGNAGPKKSSIGTPGTSRKAITVAASYKKNYSATYKYFAGDEVNPKRDQIALFSSRGPVFWKNSNGEREFVIKPDVAAPGAFICSTSLYKVLGTSECDEGHVEYSGTSMATPHVAAAVALIKQAHPNWNAEEIKNALKNSARPAFGNYSIYDQGNGIIDILGAINSSKPQTLSLDIIDNNNGIITFYINYSKSIDLGNLNLFYAKGYALDNLTRISLNQGDINGNFLIKNFDSYNLEDNYYIVKVNITEGNSTYSYVKILNLNNNKILNLSNYEIYKNNGLLPVVVKINSKDYAGFNGYDLEYSINNNKTAINSSSNALMLCPQKIGGELRNYEIANNELCNRYYNSGDRVFLWNISNISETGLYAFKLVIKIDGNNLSEISNYNYIDTKLMQGWPQHIPYQENSKWNGLLNPIVYDLDNDGYKEIIVYIGRNCYYQTCDNPYNTLMVYQYDGTLKWNKKINEDIYWIGGYSTLLPQPAIGDLDGDNKSDIIVYSPYANSSDSSLNYDGAYGHIYALDNLGNVKSGWPKKVPLDLISEFSVTDLDGDSKDEIILQSNAVINWSSGGYIINKVYIIKENQTISWDLRPSYTIGMVLSPAIGDINGDGKKEIVVINNNRTPEEEIIVYNYTGGIMSGWPKAVGRGYSSYENPIIADFNNDGINEILLSYTFVNSTNLSHYGYTYDIFYGNGARYMLNMSLFTSQLQKTAVVDIDGDGSKEISFILGNKIYLINSNGGILPGWPQSFLSIDGFYGNYGRDNPVFADIDGDKKLDIIMNNGAGLPIFGEGYLYANNLSSENYGLFAWHVNGSLINGFPRATQFSSDVAPVIADIDSDGKIEIISSSHYDINSYDHYSVMDYSLKQRSSIYVWNFDGSLPLYSSIDPDTIDEQWLGYKKDSGHAACSDCDINYFLDYPVNKTNGTYTNFVFELPDVLKVEFNGALNLSRIEKNMSLLNYIKISKNVLRVNLSELPEFNSSSVIIFRNVRFVQPKALNDGAECLSSVCLTSFYDSSSRLFYLNVSHLSNFELVEAYVPDTSSDGGAGGGSGGGGGGKINKNINVSDQKVNSSINQNSSILDYNKLNISDLEKPMDDEGVFYNYLLFIIIAIVLLIFLLIFIIKGGIDRFIGENSEV